MKNDIQRFSISIFQFQIEKNIGDYNQQQQDDKNRSIHFHNEHDLKSDHSTSNSLINRITFMNIQS
jgi:hypothetical protein